MKRNGCQWVYCVAVAVLFGAASLQAAVLGVFDFESGYTAQGVPIGIAVSDLSPGGLTPTIRDNTGATTKILEIAGNDGTSSGSGTALGSGLYLSFTITVDPGLYLNLESLTADIQGVKLYSWGSNSRVYSDIHGHASVLGDTIGKIGFGGGNHALTTQTVSFSNPSSNWANGSNVNSGNDFVGITGSITFRLPWIDASSSGTRYCELDNVTVNGTITTTHPLNSAHTPNPADGATGVDPTTVLSWVAGLKAQATGGHRVYMDTDPTKVAARSGCDVNGVTTTDPEYIPASPLPWKETFYWAVDEVNGVSVWPGEVWSFTLAEEPVPPLVTMWIGEVQENSAELFMLCDDDGNSPPQAWFMVRADFEEDWTFINGGLAHDGDLLAHKLKHLIAGTTYEVGGMLSNVVGDGQAQDLFTTPGTRPPLYIYRQPQDQLVREGAKASCSIGVVADSDSIHYMWFKQNPDGAVLPVGGDAPTLTIDALTAETEGQYYCFVTADGVPGLLTSRTVDIKMQRLMGHWKLDGDLLDASGQGWDGAMMSADTFPAYTKGVPSNGKTGQALEITSAAKNFVVIPNSVEGFNFYPGGLTASAWVKTTYRNWNNAIAKQTLTGTWKGWSLGMDPQGRVRFSIRGASQAVGKSAINDGNWHLWTAVYSADTKQLWVYVDGEFESMTAHGKAVAVDDNRVVIGAADDTARSSLNGCVDDVRIYNYPLSPLKIVELITAVRNPQMIK